MTARQSQLLFGKLICLFISRCPEWPGIQVMRTLLCLGTILRAFSVSLTSFVCVVLGWRSNEGFTVSSQVPGGFSYKSLSQPFLPGSPCSAFSNCGMNRSSVWVHIYHSRYPCPVWSHPWNSILVAKALFTLQVFSARYIRFVALTKWQRSVYPPTAVVQHIESWPQVHFFCLG